MSDRMTIVAAPRTVTGKKVKQLRRQGIVPGVIYGQKDPINVQMEVNELRRALRVAGTTQLTTLDVDGQEYTVLAREIQQHVYRSDIMHVDFMEVDMASTITSEAELVAIGESALAIEGGGMVTLSLYSVEIECLPDDLISLIEVDLSVIEKPSDTITVADINVPDGVTILTDPDALVANFQIERSILEDEEEEEELDETEAGDVEVISKGSEEEEDED